MKISSSSILLFLGCVTTELVSPCEGRKDAEDYMPFVEADTTIDGDVLSPHRSLTLSIYEDHDTLRDGGWDPDTSTDKLGLCAGDCDVHDDCRDGLMCYGRWYGDPAPPGCSGTPFEDMDYCFDATSIDLYGDQDYLRSGGRDPDTSTDKLGLCAGDCEHGDCRDGLMCYVRADGYPAPPGCSGTPFEDMDYCFDATSLDLYGDQDYLRSGGWYPDTSTDKLGLCAGDCDDHDDCRDGLMCYERVDGDPAPPGCSGTPFWFMDYCYDPSYDPKAPSAMPSSNPSQIPSSNPSSNPFATPSMKPSVVPSVKPSLKPSSLPSVKPSLKPTQTPILSPSAKPSTAPSTSCNDSTESFGSSGKLTCSMIRKYKQQKREKSCQKERIYIKCPKTCGLCCRDDPMFNFIFKNRERDCSWLANETPTKIEKVCNVKGDNVQFGCIETCNKCWTNPLGS